MGINLGKIAKQVLRTVAPMAASAVGSPALGGVVNALLGSALGTDDNAIIEQKLADADPETLAKLKNLDKELQIEMRRLGIQEQELYLGDTKDARGLASRLGKIWPQFTIFVILTFIIAACLYMLFTVEMPEGNKTVLIMILGNAVTAWLASIYFFTGTTKGSQDKNIMTENSNSRGR